MRRAQKRGMLVGKAISILAESEIEAFRQLDTCRTRFFRDPVDRGARSSWNFWGWTSGLTGSCIFASRARKNPVPTCIALRARDFFRSSQHSEMEIDSGGRGACGRPACRPLESRYSYDCIIRKTKAPPTKWSLPQALRGRGFL
jgi:hypothetical protein